MFSFGKHGITDAEKKQAFLQDFLKIRFLYQKPGKICGNFRQIIVSLNSY